ncbi:TetR/AcrR family transcriptional regulator [Desulforhabdus amnigena]|uniref:HTH tetR-type domain-containing protein n=1 Tax=Desulforhabdus amnigena TaxID=40218 RepID=A0A9W6FTJ3_9BACT|nr:TetR/AcrR family transcriptional regulator [Desulforhabdus amnigena]NLJ28408.1 TetR/AcrR family transcriptional regulator [Deltaproteobacteria bacterium]GLI33426.1 hypothetical protein DAMNIGENAA_08590 [Desulforhabdus amnigena]
MKIGQQNDANERLGLRLFINDDSAGWAEEQEKKACILHAAAKIFADKGYAGTSVREIVEAAGVTKPTLYYYFKNKEDLYIKLVDETMHAFCSVLDESLTVRGKMRKCLLALYTHLYELMRDHVDFVRLVNSMIYGPPGSTPAYDLRPVDSHLLHVFSEMLRGGVDEGELKEESFPEVILLLLGLLRTMQAHLVLNLKRSPLTVGEIKKSIDVIFDGVKPTVCSEARS